MALATDLSLSIFGSSFKHLPGLRKLQQGADSELRNDLL